MTIRGFCPHPGLVRGEACRVHLLEPAPEIEFLGRAMPRELFDRELSGSVFQIGNKRAEGGVHATARLTDSWLEMHPDPFLHRLVGGEPPGPFPYSIRPLHFLNGWTRAETLKTGDACWIWIRAEGNIPWLERAPDTLPSAFPGYPHEHLVGFWRARVGAILKPKDANAPVRKLRAVLLDERIRDHKLPRVRELYGHEPWADYSATLTDSELVEAGGELLDDALSGAKRLIDRIPKVELPKWMRGKNGGSIWSPDDFSET